MDQDLTAASVLDTQPPAGTPKPMIPPHHYDLLSRLWRRFPIPIIILAIVMVAWIDRHLEESIVGDLETATSYGAGQPAPPVSLKPLTGIHPSVTRTGGRAKESKGPLSAFRRVQLGPNEVDYDAEDVTMRLFAPRPVPGRLRQVSRQVNIGDDVTVRYFASEPAPRAQAGPTSVIGPSAER